MICTCKCHTFLGDLYLCPFFSSYFQALALHRHVPAGSVFESVAAVARVQQQLGEAGNSRPGLSMANQGKLIVEKVMHKHIQKILYVTYVAYIKRYYSYLWHITYV